MSRQLTAAHVKALLGDATDVDDGRDGIPRAAPDSTDACALLLRTASAEGWRVRIEGAGTWVPPDAPADLAVSTRAMARVADVNPSDLVATAETGVSWTALHEALADHGTWVAHDPPGTGRTLGSALATGVGGPLRAGFGMLRDQVLGLTLVSGDGRVIEVGGRVVKNVAGFDLAKLAVGSYGSFGIVTSVHLRLRTVPRADLTMTHRGTRDTVLDAARRVLADGGSPAALEVLSPAAGDTDQWTLAVRLLGTESETAAERDHVQTSIGTVLTAIDSPHAAAFWREGLAGAASQPVTLRLATLPAGLEAALDLIAHHLDRTLEGWTSVTVPAGVVRFCGETDGPRLARLRRAAAEREMPLTVERAPWTVRSEVGHFGAYREGVSRLVAGLRHAFDPAGILVVPTDAGS